ncbi:hypothetical protein D9X30_3739 [Cupriavidus sp. U2]|nr:hypothetical protein D9X30_3739 [Cupriavidus sp. U2]
MVRMSSSGILKEAGFLVEPATLVAKGEQVWHSLQPSAVAPDIIDRIKRTRIRDIFPVSGTTPFGEQILRAKSVVFHPSSELQWHIPNTSDTGDFVAIAAERLVINVPNAATDLARLTLLPQVRRADLNGADGRPGQPGWTSPHDDGSDGGAGQPGESGRPGGTYVYPAVFIFFQTITINTAVSAELPVLRIDGSGVLGGNGGRGGQGGAGGRGGRGVPGERDCFLFVCVCSHTSGNGGNGGQGGPGGRGGDAGAGGNGATLLFVGPQNQFASLEKFEPFLKPAIAGTPGQPGSPGVGGGPGGAGSKPWECVQGGLNGVAGPGPDFPDFGPGSKRSDGVPGDVFAIVRDNGDLF